MATYYNSEGGGTFENPYSLGGTVRDQYGRDVLRQNGTRYGQSYNGDQELERQRLAAREASARASSSPLDDLVAEQNAAKDPLVLIGRWKRGEKLTKEEREIVRSYLMRMKGLYSEGSENEELDEQSFNQLMVNYSFPKSSGSSGSSGGVTYFSQPVNVGGNNKKMTDSSSWTRSGTASSTSYGPSRSYGYVNKGKSSSSGSGSTMKITYGKANYN